MITFQQFIRESVFVPLDIPQTQNYWHGGNLDDYNDLIAQKNGRYEHGAGLYLTTHYGTAVDYAKGSRKLYMVAVKRGQDIADALLPLSDVQTFIETYVIGRLRKPLWARLQAAAQGTNIPAWRFNNAILHDKAVTGRNTIRLREFLVNAGIDYELVSNPFGWGEQMMVLYNMKKIAKVLRVLPTDRISVYDLPYDK